MTRFVKRLLIVLSVIIVLFFLAGFLVGNFFYTLALVLDSDKSVVLNAPANTFVVRVPDKSETEIWAESHISVEQTLPSYDGLQLNAYMYAHEQPTHRWVIASHGYTGNGRQLTVVARRFEMMGFNVLMPEARSHGKSEGEYIGMGWHDRLDLISWVDYIVENDPKAEIVLFGISMGGATVMMASGEELPSNVKAIVEDSGYSSVQDEFAYQLGELFSLPAFPVVNFASAVTQMRAGYSFTEASAVAQVAKSKTPMLFIHGAEDTFVPAGMMEELYAACTVEKEKLLVAGAGHSEAAGVAGDYYWEVLGNFIFRFM